MAMSKHLPCWWHSTFPVFMARAPLPIEAADGPDSIVTGLGPAKSQTFLSIATVLESPGLCPQEAGCSLIECQNREATGALLLCLSPHQHTHIHAHTSNAAKRYILFQASYCYFGSDYLLPYLFSGSIAIPLPLPSHRVSVTKWMRPCVGSS